MHITYTNIATWSVKITRTGEGKERKEGETQKRETWMKETFLYLNFTLYLFKLFSHNKNV
jgi:hypothetical protein